MGKVHVFFFFFVLLLAATDCVVGGEAFTDEALSSMSEEELEQICVSRGFEIMRDELDPSTGLPYELAHADFVEAAKRCLEIEEEMNELLAEYPELAEEVEAEIKRLEAEQQAKLAEVEELEKKLAETQGATEESKEEVNAAFVPSSKANDQNPGEDVKDDFEVLDEEARTEASGSIESDLEAEKLAQNNSGSNIGASNEISKKNSTDSADDLSMPALTFEIFRALVKQVESDVKRIVELVTPVVRPILRAGDVAWRHIRVAFESLRRNYQNSASDEQQASQHSA